MAFTVLMSIYKNTDPIFFRAALASVFLYQSVAPQQIVLVRDGDTSTAVETIASTFPFPEDVEVTDYFFEKSVGLGPALAKGVELSRYELIARMDDDDISRPERFEKQLAFLQHNDLDIVGGQLSEFVSDPEQEVGRRVVPTDAEGIRAFAELRSPFNHPTVLFKKQAIVDIGNYQAFEGLEDYHLWLRALARNLRVGNVKDTVINMRVGGGMYKRRGGARYLLNYMKLKYLGFKLGVVSFKAMLVSSIAMVVNVSLPASFRQRLYKIVLHKNGI